MHEKHSGLRADEREALEAAKNSLVAFKFMPGPNNAWEEHDEQNLQLVESALTSEQGLTTCNCRWDGEEPVAQCELHAAHVEAIRDWATRAKDAEAKLRAALSPQPATSEEREALVQRLRDWRPSFKGLETAAPLIRAAADALAQPAAPVALNPIARRRVFDAIAGAYDLGYSDRKAGRIGAAKEVEIDHGGALIAALEKALSASPQPAQQPVESEPRITLTGYQLREALEFLAPDGTAEQLEQELCVSIGSPKDDDGNEWPRGPVCWLEEYPEEGCLPLTGEATPPAAAEPSDAELDELLGRPGCGILYLQQDAPVPGWTREQVHQAMRAALAKFGGRQ
jgi:hypothetical protein